VCTACGIMHPLCFRPVTWVRFHHGGTATRSPAGNLVGALYHKLYTRSNAPEDGRIYRPKHVELIRINNKPLLLHLVGCLHYLLKVSVFV
jgi:hypothetical protein